MESTKFGRSATASRANTDMGASLDFGRVRRDSPFGSKDSDEHRPQSSGTDQSKRSGMGLREMEKVGVLKICHYTSADLSFHRIFPTFTSRIST